MKMAYLHVKLLINHWNKKKPEFFNRNCDKTTR